MAVLSLIYSILLFVIGFFIYIKGPHITNLIVYMIFWVAFGPLLYHMTIGIEEEEQYYNIIQWVKYLGWVIMLFEMPKQLKGNRNISKLLSIVAIIFIYCLFLAFYRGANFFNSIKFTFGCYLDVLFLVTIIDKKINGNKILKLLRSILWIETIIGITEIVFSFSLYPSNTEVVGTELTGSFIGANIYAEFISFVLFFIMYADSRKKRSFKPTDVIHFLLVTIIVLYSGVRMALISHLIISALLFLSVYSKNDFVLRHKRVIISLMGGIGFFLIAAITTYISNAEVSFDSQVSNSLERQNVLVSVFLRDDYLLEHTTLGLSAFVLSYLSINPLLGPGLFWASPAGYGGMINETSANYTDCTLALYLCEVGIIGIVLFCITYYIVLRKICKSNYGPNLAFLYLIIVTVTDSGIFFFGNYLIFIVFALYHKACSRNELVLIPKKICK